MEILENQRKTNEKPIRPMRKNQSWMRHGRKVTSMRNLTWELPLTFQIRKVSRFAKTTATANLPV